MAAMTSPRSAAASCWLVMDAATTSAAVIAPVLVALPS